MDRWCATLTYKWAFKSVKKRSLGLDIMVPSDIRLDLSDGTLVLPDEVRYHLAGRRPLYGSFMQPTVTPEQHVVLTVGRSAEIRIGNIQSNAKLWLRCESKLGTHRNHQDRSDKYLHLTHLSDKENTLDRGPALGWIMSADMMPQYPVYASVGSRRYNEWQTLAFEATTEKE